MAAAAQYSRTESNKISLEIRTKSIEQTLIPLVTQHTIGYTWRPILMWRKNPGNRPGKNHRPMRSYWQAFSHTQIGQIQDTKPCRQITTLVNHKERTKVTEKTARALMRVGEAVSYAVERFVTVGESIADENPDIREDMCEACWEARQAGTSIHRLTDINQTTNDGMPKTFAEKTAMVRSARQLLSAITRVLLIADKVIVKQILNSKEKVLSSLTELESVDSFADFVRAFSQFGNYMVELAHLTGDRQNLQCVFQDLKSDKHRAQMGSARAVLEKSTMMLLPSCKTCLRHPDCESARQNRRGLFIQMRQSLDLVHHVVTDGCYQPVSNGNGSPMFNGDSGIVLAPHHMTASRAIKDFDDQVELTRVTLINASVADKLQCALENVIENSQEFTDSAYTSHEHREKIIELTEKLGHTTQVLMQKGSSHSQRDSSSSQELETAVLKTLEVSKNLRKQLQDTAMDQASELFKTSEDHDLLKALKAAGLNGEMHTVEEISVKFEEHMEQLEEVCKLFRHIATTDPLVITAEHNENILRSMGLLVLHAARTLAEYSNSKIARENLDIFGDAWESQINDLSVLVKEVNDFCQGKTDKPVYMSLPRPGKHGTTSRSLRPAKLDAEEQAKIAKLGLEMKLITSEMDAETDKWTEPDNEIVKRAKNMSSMAFSMYLFTRGDGPLKTTQDLFVQAEYFAEEGNKLYKCVREFAQKVPKCTYKDDLRVHLERIPPSCQQLQATLKTPTFGKAATFNKVDSAIQETKNLMNTIAKVITTCFMCATKFNIDYRISPGGTQKWRGQSSYDASSDTESALSSHSDSHYFSSSSNKLVSSGTSFE